MRESGSGWAPGAAVVATVKWYNPAKDFGFLVPDDGSAEAFCHVSVVEEAGYGTLPEGAVVTCEVAAGRRGTSVSPIVAADASAAPPAGAEPGHGAPGRGLDRYDEGPVEKRRGVVKFYNAAKGYGFVVPDGGGDVFLPGSVLNRAGLGALEPGREVSVMAAQGRRGPEATDVELI